MAIFIEVYQCVPSRLKQQAMVVSLVEQGAHERL
ncbi:hypothetical protein [Coxiella burnetii]|nr:hypothetical protein [Coxiella burnetii]